MCFKFQSTLPVRGATRVVSTLRDRSAPFQSTLPVRGATAKHFDPGGRVQDFNPRSP